MRKFLASLLEVAEIAIIALGAVFIVRQFLVQPFLVSGASMSPNFSSGDYLMVDELTYRIRPPERGEVVVFRYPNDPSTFFIKRLIALPGERIALADNKITIFNSANKGGLQLKEAYLPENLGTQGALDETMGPGEYFVMGDNRPYSYDSRSWGKLPATDIVGLARIRLWPVNDFGVLGAPQY